MRLLLVSHGSGPYGAERVLLALAEGLAARGHEVVLDFPHPGPAVDAGRLLPDVQVTISDRHRLPRSGRETAGFILTGPLAAHRTRRLIRSVAPELVWLSSMFNPWAAIGARLAGRPLVWQLHERALPRPLGALMAGLMRWTGARIVTVSESLAVRYHRSRLLRGRITAIPNPLLRALRPVGPPAVGPFTVGYIGQLEPGKRVVDLVDAVSRLPGVRAVIVGGGKARAAVESAVRERGLGERLELPGYREDVADQLAGFHCLAVPSVGEAFGLVALEGMAAGVPVVAARSGALPEVLGDAALYHAPGDAVELARQIGRLRDEPELRRRLRARGIERAARFGPAAWLDRVEALITDTIHGVQA